MSGCPSHNPALHACSGLACSLSLSGHDIAETNGIVLLSAGDCGDADATVAAWGGSVVTMKQFELVDGYAYSDSGYAYSIETYYDEGDTYSGEVVEESYSDDAEGSPDPDARMLTPTQFPDRSVWPKQQRQGSRRLTMDSGHVEASYPLGIPTSGDVGSFYQLLQLFGQDCRQLQCSERQQKSVSDTFGKRNVCTLTF